MDIFKIAGLGLAAVVLAVFIKNWKPELAMQVSLAAAVIIFLMVLPYLKAVVVMFQDISEQIGLESKYLSLVLKVIGIAYVAQFAAELCRDAGETSVASKIEFAGKVIIMTLSMPVVYSLLEVVSQIIRFE
ncbi:MAG: stage III sporulation protein AD [Clostridia bacterium]|nr:stage III sporulation protein AD [Clostridia bacterium]